MPEEMWADQSDQDMADDDIAQGLFNPSDDESDAGPVQPEAMGPEPPSKFHLDVEDPSIGRDGKRPKIASLRALIAKVDECLKKPDVEQILCDIEAMPGIKLPKNRRQRRTLRQGGYKSDVAAA